MGHGFNVANCQLLPGRVNPTNFQQLPQKASSTHPSTDCIARSWSSTWASDSPGHPRTPRCHGTSEVWEGKGKSPRNWRFIDGGNPRTKLKFWWENGANHGKMIEDMVNPRTKWRFIAGKVIYTSLIFMDLIFMDWPLPCSTTQGYPFWCAQMAEKWATPVVWIPAHWFFFLILVPRKSVWFPSVSK